MSKVHRTAEDGVDEPQSLLIVNKGCWRPMRNEERAMMAEDTTDKSLSLLIEQHLPQVKHVVYQVAVHFPRHVDRDNLARDGALGLVEAARRYDEARGVPFERFAAQRIRGAILDAARAADWAARSVRTLARRLEGVAQRLATELGRLPNADEKAEALGMTIGELNRLQDRMFWPSNMRSMKVPTKTSTLVDVLPDGTTREPCEEMEHRELLSYLTDAVDLLPERHRLVVTGYFLEGRTSQELARFLGVTESRISQLPSEALAMLKEGIQAQYQAPSEEENVGARVARRKERYADSIGEASSWKSRLKPAMSVEAVTF